MQATVVDLRYHMNDVLKALDRNEEVRILYHGKLKGVIHPVAKKSIKKVATHPLFGMEAEAKTSVNEVMTTLRGGRYRDL